MIFGVALGPASESSDVAGAILGLSSLSFMCLMIVFSLIPTFLMPALMIQYAKEDQIGDMFRFSHMWDMIRARLGEYILILVLIFLIAMFLAPLGLALCVIGVFFTAWWAQLITGHLVGQFAIEPAN